MASHRRQQPDGGGAPQNGWIMTYGDMMSLLLTFFVLIVSFSSIQESKFKNAAISLRAAFGVLTDVPSVISMPEPIVPRPEARLHEDVLAEVKRLERSLLDLGVAQEVDVEVTETGVAFRIQAPFMFDSGRAALRPETLGMMDNLAQFFHKFPYPIRIEGHTDSVPISTVRFPSNWDLSAARAVAVARRLQEGGVAPQRIEAVGMGEYRPLDGNDTAAGRARNRRVEIFLRLEDDQAPPRALPTAAGEE